MGLKNDLKYEDLNFGEKICSVIQLKLWSLIRHQNILFNRDLFVQKILYGFKI